MKKTKLASLTLSVLLASSVVSPEVFAQNKKAEVVLLTKNKELLEDPYYQIKATKVRELTDEEVLELAEDFNDNSQAKNISLPARPSNPVGATTPATTPAAPSSTKTPEAPQDKPTGFLDSVIMVVDKLIAIGQKVIPTIEKGKSVVTNNPMAAVSVIPRFDTINPVLHEMENWSIPVTKHYKIAYENGWGSEIVSFVYSVTYQYGGQFEGKGKYLTGIRASARNISVAWGFDLDASSQLIQISNIGTNQDVIAGATVEISYTVKNWTRIITTNESFFIAGDGRMFKLD
jgi:hypothetical protein